jgi:hypothetical protein
VVFIILLLRFRNGINNYKNIGYESACMSERVFSPNYHSARDKIEHVNQDLLVEFSKLAISYLVETS